MDEIADPLSMDLFNSIMNWDYSSLDGTNLTVSCILGVDMPGYMDMSTLVPATDLPSLVGDPTEPTSCLSPRLNDDSIAPETSIAECYSRAHSPPLDRGKVGLGDYVTDRAGSEGQLEFPDMTGFTAQELDREDHAHVEACDSARFQPAFDLAEKIRISAFFPQSMRLKLPLGEVLNAFIQLYFEHFHPQFPLIHMPTFSSPETHPLLMFAVASIGAKYSKLKGAHKCSLAMHELIRQQTTYLSEHATKLSREPWLLQAILLNLIGLMYSGDKRSLRTAEMMQSAPAVLARRSGLFEEKLSPEKMATLQLSRDRLWKLWVFAEGRRRLAHAIWIIDSSFRLHFDLCTTMDFAEIRNRLPQSDKLWSAPSAQAWMNTNSLLDPVRDATIQEFFESGSQTKLWMSTSTLGRQAIAQFLWYTTLKHQRTMGWRLEASLDHSADGERAAKRLSDLVSLDDAAFCEDLVELPILQTIFHIAQAKRHCPIPNFSNIIIRYMCNALDEPTLEEATRLWTGSIRSAKTAILHASCVVEIIRKYRPTSFAVSVMLFKAVLMLWSYSKFLLPKPEVTDEGKPGRGLRSVLLGCRTNASSKDVWLNDGKAVAKLAGIGHLDKASSRRKLLEEAVAFMEMGSIWMLGQCLAKCLVRLKERELVEKTE